MDNPTHVANKIIEKKLSVRQAESLVRVFKMKKGSSKNLRDPNLQSLESSIIEKIGLKVFIKNTKKNIRRLLILIWLVNGSCFQYQHVELGSRK